MSFRHPLMLPCQHVYCYGCLYQLKANGDQNCPYCKRAIEQNVDELPQPRLIMSLMEICSKGIPSIDVVQLEKDYPSNSGKSQMKKILWVLKSLYSLHCSRCTIFRRNKKFAECQQTVYLISIRGLGSKLKIVLVH